MTHPRLTGRRAAAGHSRSQGRRYPSRSPTRRNAAQETHSEKLESQIGTRNPGKIVAEPESDLCRTAESTYGTQCRFVWRTSYWYWHEPFDRRADKSPK